MKHRTFSEWILGVLFTLSVLAAGYAQAATESTSVATNAAALDTNTVSAATNATNQAALAGDTDAPATLVSDDKPLPASLKPSRPVSEVIKLANAGVTEAVMLAYVTNSMMTFNLSAEDIIYLNDIGVPGTVVTAMIQRDQVLKPELAAAAAGPPAAAPETEPPPSPLPPPAQEPAWTAGPEPDQAAPPEPESASPYPVEAPLTPADDGSVPMFYDALAPYGNWVDIQGYGRCWQPSVVALNSGWQPYFDCGHWVYSDCGWYWLSDYSWGWAPFHYGGWFRHARLGWCWRPGRVWGPSWVCWRYNRDYCGWAPLPPSVGFVAGVGLTFHGHSVYDRDDFGLRPGHYHFVAWNHFNDRHLRPHGLRAQEGARAYHNSTVAARISGDGHTVVNNGLPPSRVAAATRQPIHTVALRQVSAPMSNGGHTERFEANGARLAVYRPNPADFTRTARPHAPGSLGAGVSAPAPAWAPRNANPRQSVTELRQDNPPPGSTAPLILRGEQPSGLRETAPPSSLIVIGRRNSARPAPSAQPWGSAPSAPSAPSAASALPWSSAPSAARAESAAPARPARPDNPDPNAVAADQNAVPRRPGVPGSDRNWMGMVSSSPQPSWFGNRDAAVPRQYNGGNGMTVPRPDPRVYQPVPRSAAPQVPRYAPAPNYVPQRSYSAPAWSPAPRAPAYNPRPAVPAPSAPSAAPAAPRSAPAAPAQQAPGRTGR